MWFYDFSVNILIANTKLNLNRLDRLDRLDFASLLLASLFDRL